MGAPPTRIQNPELEPDIRELLDSGKNAQQIATELVVPINDVLIVQQSQRDRAAETPPPTSAQSLIARGKSSGVPRIVRLSQRAEDAMLALAAALHEHDSKAELRARAKKLEAELKQVRASLRGATTSTGQVASIDTQKIRAWARENGHQVPGRGRLPAEVVTAYREAHAT